jgi:hypothetical protein
MGMTLGLNSGHTPPLPEVNFLMVEIPTPKPYIFMIRVTRKIKCLIAQAPGGHTPPLPEINFLMVEIRVRFDPRGMSYKAFHFPSHPDHKYIWFRGRDLNH